MPVRQRFHDLVLTLILALSALIVLSPSFAQSPPTPKAPAASPIQAPVIVNGQVLFSVGGPDPQTRAQRINGRLKTLVTRESDVADFTVDREGESYLLVVGDIPVMTVTATDAQDALMTPEALSREWGQILTQAVQQARAERRSWLRRVLNPVRRSMDQLLDQTLEALPRFLSALILIVLTSFAARLVKAGVTPLVRRARLDDNLRQLIRSLSFYATWAVGLMMMATVLGFQAASLVTALGVGGFVLGFAFKDILSHFLAGILLLAGRAFQIGDQIAIREFEGTVEAIDLRATHVRTYDNRLVIVPNADVFTSAVVNNTQSRIRRQEFDVGVDYATDLAGAQLLAFETMKETKGVMADPSPDVLIAEFGSSGILLRCRFWTDSRRANVLAVGSEVRRRVKVAFDREGVSIPFEIREIRLESPVRESLLQGLGAISPDSGDSDERQPSRRPASGTAAPARTGESEKTAPEKEEASAAKAEAALPQHLSAETE